MAKPRAGVHRRAHRTKDVFSDLVLFVGWALPTARDAPVGRLYATGKVAAAVSRSCAVKLAETTTAGRGLLVVARLQYHLGCDGDLSLFRRRQRQRQQSRDKPRASARQEGPGITAKMVVHYTTHEPA